MEMSYRHLPHLHAGGRPVFVTFRLYGCLPVGRSFSKQNLTSGEAFVALDRLLDTARFGPIYMARPEVAGLVRGCIQHCAAGCEMHAWVIMPNHVHLLFTPHGDGDVSELLRRLKGYSAREVNKLLGRTGQPFWQDESYDHLVRNREEFRRIERYIVNNPVKAGLVQCAEEFAWSSISKTQD
jgi:REP element-mobilizing transposase RayT